jgi:hypothetical protein
MKLPSLTSKNLFKATVALLAIPAILFLVGVSLMIFFAFSRWAYGGIGSFTFAITRFQLMTVVVAAAIGFFGVLYAVGLGLFRRHQSRKAHVD